MSRVTEFVEFVPEIRHAIENRLTYDLDSVVIGVTHSHRTR